jgi:hypothetical protein
VSFWFTLAALVGGNLRYEREAYDDTARMF